MVIGMAVEAVGFQSQVSKFFRPYFGIGNKFSLMTIGTLFTAMCTSELVSGLFVFKLFGIEPYDFKIHAMMIIMASGALFAPHFVRCMIAFLLIDACFQFGMARQAFLIRNLFAQGMAFGAIAHAFEM